MTDEPILGGGDGRSATGDDTEARELVRCLVTSQPYAVLSTQAAGQPYASLVAFAVTEDLASLVFATPVFTRKYELLKNCHNVALLIDDRPQHADLITVAATWQAKHAGREDADFLAQLKADPDVARHFKKGELEALCSLDFHFKEVKTRFRKLGL